MFCVFFLISIICIFLAFPSAFFPFIGSLSLHLFLCFSFWIFLIHSSVIIPVFPFSHLHYVISPLSVFFHFSFVFTFKFRSCSTILAFLCALGSLNFFHFFSIFLFYFFAIPFFHHHSKIVCFLAFIFLSRFSIMHFFCPSFYSTGLYYVFSFLVYSIFIYFYYQSSPSTRHGIGLL